MAIEAYSGFVNRSDYKELSRRLCDEEVDLYERTKACFSILESGIPEQNKKTIQEFSRHLQKEVIQIQDSSLYSGSTECLDCLEERENSLEILRTIAQTVLGGFSLVLAFHDFVNDRREKRKPIEEVHSRIRSAVKEIKDLNRRINHIFGFIATDYRLSSFRANKPIIKLTRDWIANKKWTDFFLLLKEALLRYLG